MLSVTQLAKISGISRTTLLYYERAGLLLPASRTDKGYRMYGETERKKLESIVAYRSFGLPVARISELLAQDDSTHRESILRNQFTALEADIRKLRNQQHAILKLLEQHQLLEETMVTKKRWTEIMQAAGLSEEDMTNWHRQFEKMEPDSHQEFLESLGIDAQEVVRIRDWSRQ